jgi:hypothetical protein
MPDIMVRIVIGLGDALAQVGAQPNSSPRFMEFVYRENFPLDHLYHGGHDAVVMAGRGEDDDHAIRLEPRLISFFP